MNKDAFACDHNDFIQPKPVGKHANFDEASLAAWAYAAALLKNFPSLQPIQESTGIAASLESVAKAALDNEIDLNPFADILSNAETEMTDDAGPCREVSWDDWFDEYKLSECEPVAATSIVRARVAEALADMVPKARYYEAEARTSWAKLALNEIMDAANGTTIGSAFEDLEYIERIAKETILRLED